MEPTSSMPENTMGVPMKCHRCDHEWVYKGRSPYYATCPLCHTTVKIRKQFSQTKAKIADEKKIEKYADIGENWI